VMILYRKKICKVLCPVIFMAVVISTLELTRLRVADRRKSCGIIETSKSLTGTKFTAYRDSILRFEIGGRIRFVDAFDVPRERNFGFHCDCRKDSQAEFTPSLLLHPTRTARRCPDQSRPERWNSRSKAYPAAGVACEIPSW
jgi:hypothetical protein